MCGSLLAGLVMLWGGYMLIISNVIIGQIVGLAVILTSGLCVILITYNLFKPINTLPIMTINPDGIYHKQISSIPIPWDNIRLIWKSSMTIPRRLYIETMDHSPSKCPHNIFFTVLTPGFSDAWRYLNNNYPDKIRGNTDETSKISL
jgi:hypothetical protein